ncbi:tRNA (adenosine(37)-N6)-threonylcarbamoyltransferase complex dimerization subunit type 1 TsaB [Ohtaekwangia kribbensis]|jgi:tRNA threonylcarbamoyladenosine biosynthesis protein TsaB|uniref:tRNA (Adenosine(37)-N6)-threonylcarbamoyltransferase complex dimerization subunit type 1 TsaB n=1 Tax=Ohtaekwangia kribbensis TaxID=688913 RepID=A0ABW3K9B3_9BACT
MALILSLETSTTVCSVALHNNGKLVASAEMHKEQSHASKLAVLIDQVVKLADIPMSAIQAIAVSEGPGSYTGLRIGVSTAKGLCFALGIPLLSVSTLSLLAKQIQLKAILDNAWLCPMIDARRMEVYCQIFDSEINVLRPIEAKVIDEESFRESLSDHKIIFFGDGAAKCKSVITHSNAFFISDIVPSAKELGFLASEKFSRNEFENLVTFEPFYLKEFLIKKPADKDSAVANKIS